MEKTKLRIGGTLKEAFALYRKNFGVLLKFALVSVLCTIPMTVGIYIMGIATEGMTEMAGNLLGSDFAENYGDFDFGDYDFNFEDYTLPEDYVTDVALKGNLAAEDFEDFDVYDFDAYDFDAYGDFGGYESLLGGNEAALAKSIGLIVVALLLILFSSLLTLIVGSKVQLGAQFYLADSMVAGGEGEMPTVKGAYAKTKGKVGTLVGYTLLLGLIAGACVMPLSFIIGIAIGAAGLANTSMVIWIVIPLVVPIVFCLQPWGFLLTPVVAFDKQNGSKLSRTSKVIKGNFFRIACVALVATFASSGIVWLCNVLTSSVITFALGDAAPGWLSPVVSGIVSALITMITFGFAAAAAAVTYQKLKPEDEDPYAMFGYPQPQPQEPQLREPQLQVPAEYNMLPPLEPQVQEAPEPAASEDNLQE